MNTERFTLLREAMKERIQSGYFCDDCREPIEGKRHLVVETDIPSRGLVPAVSILLRCDPCQMGGDDI